VSAGDFGGGILIGAACMAWPLAAAVRQCRRTKRDLLVSEGTATLMREKAKKADAELQKTHQELHALRKKLFAAREAML